MIITFYICWDIFFFYRFVFYNLFFSRGFIVGNLVVREFIFSWGRSTITVGSCLFNWDVIGIIFIIFLIISINPIIISINSRFCNEFSNETRTKRLEHVSHKKGAKSEGSFYFSPKLILRLR